MLIKRRLSMFITILTLSLACLAQAQSAGDMRVLKVRVAADEVFRALPEWENLLRKKIAYVSDIYERRFKLRLEILDIVEWKTGGDTTVTETLFPRLIRDVAQGDADILLGISSRECSASAKTVGYATSLGSAALVMPGCNDLGRGKVSFEQVLSHEIGHLFGAFHVVSVHSVMSGGDPDEFDSQTSRIIHLFRDLDLRRGVQGASEEQIKKYVEIYSELHALDTPHPVALSYQSLARKAAEEGKYEDALKLFMKAIEFAPNWAAPHGDAGSTCLRLNRPEEAQRHYQRALELAPENAYFRGGVAVAKAKLGGSSDTIKELRQAAEQEPDNAIIQTALGDFLIRAGKKEEAETCLRRAIMLDPNNFYAQERLGLTLEMQDKLEEAVVFLRRSVELKPDFWVARANLGYTLDRLGKLSEALEQYREALRLNPNDTNSKENLDDALTRVNGEHPELK